MKSRARPKLKPARDQIGVDGPIIRSKFHNNGTPTSYTVGKSLLIDISRCFVLARGGWAVPTQVPNPSRADW